MYRSRDCGRFIPIALASVARDGQATRVVLSAKCISTEYSLCALPLIPDAVSHQGVCVNVLMVPCTTDGSSSGDIYNPPSKAVIQVKPLLRGPVPYRRLGNASVPQHQATG